MALKVSETSPQRPFKAPRTGPAPSDLEAVGKAFAEPGPLSAYLPASARSMLMGGLPHAVATVAQGEGAGDGGKLERHPLQEEVLAMVEGVLKRAAADNAEERARVDEQVRSVATAETKRAAEAACAQAALDVEAAAAAMEAKRAELVSAEAATVEAKRDYDEANDAHKPAEWVAAKASELKKKADHIARVLRELQAEDAAAAAEAGDEELGAGAPAATAPKAALAGPKEREVLVVEFLRAGRAERALVAAAEGCLRLPSRERRPFDDIVFEGVADQVSEAVREAEAKVAAAGPALEESAAIRLGMFAIHDLALEAKAAAASALHEAEQEHEVTEARRQQLAAEARERDEEYRESVRGFLLADTLAEARARVVGLAQEAFTRLTAGPAEAPPAQAAA